MPISKLFWSIPAVFVATSTHADLIYVDVIWGADQHPDGKHNTLQIIALFSDENDKILGVDGLPLRFITDGGDLYNQGLFAGIPLNDFPSVGIGGEAYDSYVTIGATSFPANTQFTDDFLGNWEGNPPPIQVIEGGNFCGEGGWFYFGDPPTVDNFPDMVPGNGAYDVIIAQFTVDNDVKFLLQGNIIWQQPDSDKNISTPFTTIQSFAGHFLQCPWDLDGSDDVSTADILLLFAAWGPNSFTCGPPEFNNDGIVNTSDLLELFANWGPCP